jgi:hypothetical protein
MRLRAHVVITTLIAVAFPTARAPERSQPFRQRAITLRIAIDMVRQRLDGTATITLENWTGRPQRQVPLLLNRLLSMTSVRAPGGATLPFRQQISRIVDDSMWQVDHAIVDLPTPVAPGKQTTIVVSYAGNLVGYTETGSLYIRDHVDSSFTILRADALAFPVPGTTSFGVNRMVPSVDFAFDATVIVPPGFQVATGGALMGTTANAAAVSWRYRSTAPTPFLNISIARYDTLSSGGVRVFAFPADSLGARRVLQRTLDGLALLKAWFGALGREPSPTVIEIPEGWGSQASLAGGIIQEASSFQDSANLAPLYHELSHLWNAPDTDAPSPRWNEGLAMFLQLRMRATLDGWPGTLGALARRLGSLRQALSTDSALRTTPVIDYGRARMTDWSYSAGQLMFAVLHEITGDAEFDRIVGGYFRSHRSGGSTSDFMAYATRSSAHHLDRFFDDWMRTTRWTSQLDAGATVETIAEPYR